MLAPVALLGLLLAGPAAADPVPGVRAIGARVWAVDRALVEVYGADLDALDALGSVYLDDEDDGRPDGWRIFGVPPGGLLEAVGLVPGDTVEEVNGRRVDGLLETFFAWRAARDADVVHLRVVRDGVPLSLIYVLE